RTVHITGYGGRAAFAVTHSRRLRSCSVLGGFINPPLPSVLTPTSMQQGSLAPRALPRFVAVGSEEARLMTLASVRRSNCTCSFPACSFHESATRGRGVNEGIRPLSLTSPSSPRRRGVGRTFHPGQRHRRKRCDHSRRSTQPSSW